MSKTPKLLKIERVENANKFILSIANHGRKFFRFPHPAGDQIASIILGEDGKLFFWNEWNFRRIYISKHGPWKYFHHGGTLYAVVSGLVRYIKTGATMNASFFDRHWGYGDEINFVVKDGLNLGILHKIGG